MKNKEDLNKLYNRRNNLSNKGKINPIDEISRQDLINHRKELKRRNKNAFKRVSVGIILNEAKKFDIEKVKKAKEVIKSNSYANLDNWKVDPKKVNSKVIKRTKEKLFMASSHNRTKVQKPLFNRAKARPKAPLLASFSNSP